VRGGFAGPALRGTSFLRRERARFGMLGARAGTAELGGGAGVELVQLPGGGTPVRFEADGVPAGQASACLVRALAERQQRRSWISRAAHSLVGKHRQRARAVLDPAARGQRLLAESLGLGRGVGVVGAVVDGVVARPEPERDDLVRVGLLVDRIGIDR
jgi:hypothetical protein